MCWNLIFYVKYCIEMLLKIGYMLYSILIVFFVYVLVSIKKNLVIIEGNVVIFVRFL